MSTRASVLSVSILLTLAPVMPASAQDPGPCSSSTGCSPTGPSGLFEEWQLLTKAVNLADPWFGGGDPDDGWYAQFGDMITGAGWLVAGPGYRRHVMGHRAVVDASAALSTNLYKAAQARIDWPHLAGDRLAAGAQATYQDARHVDYFGRGPDSLRSNRIDYRLENFDLVGYATIRATRWLTADGRVGRVDGPGHRLPSFVHGDVTIAADWLDQPGHPVRGGRYSATAAMYSDRAASAGSFRRYEVEGSQFIPLFTLNWVLALHAWEVFSLPSAGNAVPFYLLPSIGGANTLRGYDDYRFHDNDTQSFNVESRWAPFAHVDAVAFADAGKVAPDAGGLDFRHLRTSYGAGLRVHGATSTLGRVDVGHSREGWRIFFSMSDPFKRSTPASGRRSVVPFVP